MDCVEITIKYNNAEYKFDSGIKAYIFHTGIYNEIDARYGIDALLEYVNKVYSCCISDCYSTNIGALADYIASDWKRVKNKSEYKILDRFYTGGIC